MNLPLPNIADEAEPKAERPQPQVLVRVIVTPPGAPWEQARAAKLDAQHGAPLPISELIHQLRRLAPWAPGRPGRYPCRRASPQGGDDYRLGYSEHVRPRPPASKPTPADRFASAPPAWCRRAVQFQRSDE